MSLSGDQLDRPAPIAAAGGLRLSPLLARTRLMAERLRSKQAVIGLLSIAAIACHLVLRFGFPSLGELYGVPWREVPLLLAFGAWRNPAPV
jgi:hypothetical protein